MNFATPLPFSAALPADLSQDELSLHYELEPCEKTQKQNRFQGRLALRPRLRISDYRCDAVIDWIELSYVTPDEHQATNIYRSLEQIVHQGGCTFRVTGASRKNKYQGDEFYIRIFDPTPAVVDGLHEKMLTRWTAIPDHGDFVGRVRGAEVSIDFYPFEPGDVTDRRIELARWRMSRLLRTHWKLDKGIFEHDHMDRPRHYDAVTRQTHHLVASRRTLEAAGLRDGRRAGLSSRQLAFLETRNHYLIPVDGTLYLGRENGEVFLRIQDKTEDARHASNKTVRRLSTRECRSRIEITLSGEAAEACGLLSVDTLHGFSFPMLRKVGFQFRIPTVVADRDARPLIPVEMEVFRRTGVYGLNGYQYANARIMKLQPSKTAGSRRGRHLGEEGFSLAYDDMHDACDRALRRLAARWR